MSVSAFVFIVCVIQLNLPTPSTDSSGKKSPEAALSSSGDDTRDPGVSPQVIAVATPDQVWQLRDCSDCRRVLLRQIWKLSEMPLQKSEESDRENTGLRHHRMKR